VPLYAYDSNDRVDEEPTNRRFRLQLFQLHKSRVGEADRLRNGDL
jgi:hypothetical protein